MSTPKESAKPVRQNDIARALGVSQVTVSLALRNSPMISEELRRQVQAVAVEMGYRPNPSATALAHFKRPHVVPTVHASLAWINGWSNPEKLRSHREFDCYWRGAAQAAETLGYRLEEFCLNRDMTPRQLQRILVARDVAGVLIPPHSQSRDDWLKLDWTRFSVVRFGRSVRELPVHSVTADQAANGLLAFNTLFAKGYRRIGYIGSRGTSWLAGAGYYWAQTHVPEGERLTPLLFLPDDHAQRSALVAEWVRQNRPDGILTDEPLLPVYLRQHGWRVPEDIGLAALTVLDCPINAGIDQHPEEIGRVAVHTLLTLIHTRQTGFPEIYRETLIPGSWVDGSDLPTRVASKT